MEKKISRLSDTVIRMQEENNRISQMNIALITKIFSQSMGVTVPKKQLEAVGSSPEINRNAIKSKKGVTFQAANLPETHETLGQILKLMSAFLPSQRRTLLATPVTKGLTSSPKNVLYAYTTKYIIATK